MVVLPASLFFSSPELRRSSSADLVVYGPAHLFRKAWLSGVRDYLKEPWQPEELFLRIRGPLPSTLKWNWGGHRLSLEGMTLHSQSAPGVVRLSRTEGDLLRILVERQGRTVSRTVLSWAAQCSGGRVIDTLVARLRRKLQAVTDRDDNPIPSVRGLGYRIP